MNDIYPFRIYKKKPIYKGYKIDSKYLTMRDGVKIATQIYLPKKLPPNKKLPTVLVQTRYWRAVDIRIPFKWIRREPFDPKTVKILTSYGFAVVCIDVRGCGASEGTRSWPFDQEEIKDGKEVIDWIIKQTWSAGKVLAYGNSYTGQTAEFVATLNHPAVKGIIPKHNAWDPYSHIGFPGGIFNEAFVSYWATLGRGQDQNPKKALKAFKPLIGILANIVSGAIKDVKPVKGDENRTILREAQKTHRANKYIIDYKDNVAFRDDVVDKEGRTLADISIFPYKEQIEKGNLPLYCWGSWMDSASADVVISRFLTFNNPQRVIITDFDHSDKRRASPFFSPKDSSSPNFKEQIKDWITFFNECLEEKASQEKILYYYTMGEEKWKRTTKWPPEGQTYQKWYLGESKSLTLEKPTGESEKDQYKVDYSATTGIRNRWYTLLSLPVAYPKRDEADKKLLCYTSEPLEEDMEITGHPIMTLYMSSTHEDGAVIVYLEFIDKEGKVKYITEGHLRLNCRSISEETPPYKICVPYHSCKKEDAQPMIPGKIAEISFGLIPTSILIPKGYKTRIAIAGADKDSFSRYPKEGKPTITVERNKANPSFIDIPVIPK